MNEEQALALLTRRLFNENERDVSNAVHELSKTLIRQMFHKTKPSAELTLAVRKISEAVMYHSLAIKEHGLNG